jgi:hypothetical protein
MMKIKESGVASLRDDGKTLALTLTTSVVGGVII